MKRVIHVFGNMDLGGAETRTMEIFRNIDKDIITFDFLVMKTEEGYYDKEIRELGGNIIRISSPREVNFLKHFYEIIVTLKKNGPYDAVHSHTSFHTGITSLAAFVAGVKIRITHSRTASNINNKGVLRKLYFMLMRILIKAFATIKVACGKDAAKFLYGKRAVKKNKVKIIYNSIDIKQYSALDSRNIKLRSKLGINEEELVIGHVGSFKEVKNHKFIIDILSELKSRNIKFKFVFIGTGPLYSKIEKLTEDLNIGNDVLFLGVRNDIPQIMSMIDLFLLPSLYEGLPGVILEAQGGGTPCLVSDTVTNEVDIGLGLVKHLPINNINPWVEDILHRKTKNKVDYESLLTSFESKGFTVSNSIKQFYLLYGIS